MDSSEKGHINTSYNGDIFFKLGSVWHAQLLYPLEELQVLIHLTLFYNGEHYGAY